MSIPGVTTAVPARGSAGGRTAWLGCPCPMGSACCLSPDVASRGCSALASAPAAREIKDMAAAVPALEISCLGWAGLCNWAATGAALACPGVLLVAQGATRTEEQRGQGWMGRRFGVGPRVLGNVADTTCSSHKNTIPMAGQASWDAQLGPWDTRSLQCSLSPRHGDSACCAPRVVAQPHPGCVVALGDKASQEPRARLNKQLQPNPSFQTGNFPLPPHPCQSSSWGCDPLLAMDEGGGNLTWRGG